MSLLKGTLCVAVGAGSIHVAMPGKGLLFSESLLYETINDRLEYYVEMAKQYLPAHQRFWKPLICLAISPGMRKYICHEELAKIGDVSILDEADMAAIGSQKFTVEDLGHRIILDIGSSSTDLAAVFNGRVFYRYTAPCGGAMLTEAIIKGVRSTYNFSIGKKTAEKILASLGDVSPGEGKKDMMVKFLGRDLSGRATDVVEITSSNVRTWLKEPMERLLNGIRRGMAYYPPYFTENTLKHGFYLIGGVARLRGLDELLKQEFHRACRVADNPQLCVIKGLMKTCGSWPREYDSCGSWKYMVRRNMIAS